MPQHSFIPNHLLTPWTKLDYFTPSNFGIVTICNEVGVFNIQFSKISISHLKKNPFG
jgi:hypothetical protein